VDYNDLVDIESEFVSLSDYFLTSTEDTFTANLLSFKEFCDLNKPISDILKPISQNAFNGIEYFHQKSRSGSRHQPCEQPKNRDELLKFTYDVLWYDKLHASNIWGYARMVLNPDTKMIDELLIIGNKDISTRLIDYIDLQLNKLINRQKQEPVPSQQTFNIGNAHGSIIGSQTNATINSGITFDEAIKIIESKNIDSIDKHQLIELTNYVKLQAESNAPMNKGLLSKFSDIISKHAWAASLIGSTLIKHFLS